MNNYIIITREQSTKMEVGTLLNNENGTNGGLVTEIIPDGDNAKVYGTWAEPQPGEKWLYSHVKEVIDNGGHRNLNNLINYGPQSKRWQGNTSTGEIKEMHLTEADFGKNADGNWPRIKMNCWIVDVHSIYTPAGKNIEIANVGKDDLYKSIYKMGYPITERLPIWSKYIDLIGTGGRFEIIIRWKSY